MNKTFVVYRLLINLFIYFIYLCYKFALSQVGIQ